MNRRNILSGLALVLVSARATHADVKPWLATILNGPAQNGKIFAGLELVMQPHWKTYWRVPGQGGVPPFVDLKGENVKSFRLECPTPTRFPSEAGEAIGYMENVVFPIIIEPVDAAKPVEADISAFVGVCLDVCIPAKIDGHFSSISAKGADRLPKWQALVPVPNSKFVTSSTTMMIDGKAAVRFELSQKLDDIFVEGSDLHYFKAPVFDGTGATIIVAGAKSVDEIKKMPLRVTGKLPAGGLEQMVTVV
jgi:DsbC/DsbD-like thiol-disulfide interchange protein